MIRLAIIFVVCAVIAVALFAYGQYRPRQWQAQIPRTNMRDVEASVGKPLHVSTNADGSVRWDYTRWWTGTAQIYFYKNGDFYRIFTEW